MKTAFVTGILGQDGPYLAQLLLEKGYKVYGLIRRYSNPNFENINYLGIADDVEFVEGDLTDETSLHNLIKTTQPDEVYNLGAQSFVHTSFEQAKLTTEVNSLGVLYLLNAIRQFSPKARYYQASTSEMFGLGNDSGYQDENTQFHPRSPYGVAKLYGYWLTVNYRESYNMFTTNGILFNHESPIRGKQFVTRKVTDGVARIKYGFADKLHLGNLDAVRDWGFAGDYVEAMYLMLQHDKPDDYVVATGKAHSVEKLVELAFKYAGMGDYKQYIELDKKFERPAEVPHLCGRSDKARKTLGWEPKVSFEELVKMMVEADLKRYEDKKDQHKG